MIERSARHDNVISELEAANEAALGNPAVQEITVIPCFRLGLARCHGQLAFLCLDLEIGLREAGHGNLDCKGIFVNFFNIVRRITLRAVQPGSLIDHAGKPVKANHGPIKRGKVDCIHSTALSKATVAMGDAPCHLTTIQPAAGQNAFMARLAAP